jgi:hypothetical protein
MPDKELNTADEDAEVLADLIEDSLQPLVDKYGLSIAALTDLTIAIITNLSDQGSLRRALNQTADDHGIPVKEWVPICKELIDMVGALPVTAADE